MNKNVEGHLTGKWKEEFVKRKYRLHTHIKEML